MSGKTMDVSIVLNGKKVSDSVAPDTSLLAFVRDHGCKSVKCACETTNCGLCTVWLDGRAVLSCAVPMVRADGHEVTTLEGVRAESADFARCMAEEGAEQCGFCSPGLIMNVLAMEREIRARAEERGADPTMPSEEDMNRYLAGNLCRCTGYTSQRRAIRRYLASRFPSAAGAAPESALVPDDAACAGEGE